MTSFTDCEYGPAAGWRVSAHSATAHPPACVEASPGHVVTGGRGNLRFVIDPPTVPSRTPPAATRPTVTTTQQTGGGTIRRPALGPYAAEPLPESQFVLGGGDGEVVDVPQELNFVWLGGSLRFTARENIVAWIGKARDAGWRVRIWADDEAATANADFLATHFTGEQAEVRRITPSLFDGDRLVSLFGDDPQKKVFDYAISKRAFAMASDVARYAILRRHGGIYADVDLTPGRVDLPRAPLRMPNGEHAVPFLGPLIRDRFHILAAQSYFELRNEHFTGDELVEQAARLNYAYGRLGNQFIVAPPRSRFLERLYQDLGNADLRRQMRNPHFNPRRNAADHTGPSLWERQYRRPAERSTMDKIRSLAGRTRTARPIRLRPRVDPAMLEQWAGLGWVSEESDQQENTAPRITKNPLPLGDWAETVERAVEETYRRALREQAPETPWIPASPRPGGMPSDLDYVVSSHSRGDACVSIAVIDRWPSAGR